MPRILIAEDDIGMQSMLAAAFVHDGFQVEVADGKGLAEVLQAEKPPDIIISDVHMPGFSGFDLLAWARDNCPKVPVIMISSFGGPRTRQRLWKMGAAALFDKPFPVPELQDSVHKLLENC